MSKKSKTTHDVSVRGETFNLVKAHCLENGGTPGPEVSRWIDDHFDYLEAHPPQPVLTPEEAAHEREVVAEAEEHFTF